MPACWGHNLPPSLQLLDAPDGFARLDFARNPTVLVRLQGPFSAADLLRHCLVGTASEDVNRRPRALAPSPLCLHTMLL